MDAKARAVRDEPRVRPPRRRAERSWTTLLEEIGWAEALATDPRTAVSTLFELQGASGATSSALGTVLLDALGLPNDGDSAVVLPPLGSIDPRRGWIRAADRTGRVALRGVGLSEMRRRPRATVIAERGDGVVTSVAATADLSPRSVDGLDPTLELVELDVEWRPERRRLVTGERGVDGRGGGRPAGHRARDVRGDARRCSGSPASTRSNASSSGDRSRTFQAVRHRLADSYVAIEATDAALDGAWLDGSPFSAALAKAVAGQSARTVRRHCQQVLAGIGFTTEHDLHRFVRRTMVLDALLGDARTLTHQLGADLIRDGHLPRLLPL